MTDKPALFGIKNSNRDFSSPDSWSKNKFNSSFPASLVAYMGSKDVKCVYLKLAADGTVVKDYISADNLFRTRLDNYDLHYSFEASYTPFQPLVFSRAPMVDLMLMNQSTGEVYSGFEIKLTTLPDETTFKLKEEYYGCELVIRQPSIVFLGCSIASMYRENRKRLSKYFGKHGFGNVSSYMEAAQVNPRLGDIWSKMNELYQDNLKNQKPAIIQPVWKTEGKSSRLADNCLDVFVWSDLAFTQLFMADALSSPVDQTVPVNRPTRALIQLFFMLNEYYVKGQFDHSDIFQKLSYTFKNDKAFSVSGKATHRFMSCDELTKPRIRKEEIKNIILGGGQKLLSPERRFDAVLVNSPELFI